MANQLNRLLTPKEAMSCLGVGRTKFYQGIADGIYPGPIYPLGSKRPKFVEIEILALQHAAIEERDARIAKGLSPVVKRNPPGRAVGASEHRRVA